MTFDALACYEKMFLIRRIEETIAERYPEGRMRLPVHLSSGQEAAAVGVIMALNQDDQVYAGHRAHAHYLAKGGSPDALIGELYGKATGCTGGFGGSMYLTAPQVGFVGSFAIVGDCISVATGAALAFKLEESSKVAVAFFGDSAVETGQFWESVNFACTHRLPILYVCENNRYATATPIEQRQPAKIIMPRLEGFKKWLFAGWTNDNPEMVYTMTRMALERLPAFVEIQTYRFRGHVSPDREAGAYRTQAELEAAMARDPLAALERELLAKYGEHRLKPIWTKANEAVRLAFERAEAAQEPSMEGIRAL